MAGFHLSAVFDFSRVYLFPSLAFSLSRISSNLYPPHNPQPPSLTNYIFTTSTVLYFHELFIKGSVLKMKSDLFFRIVSPSNLKTAKLISCAVFREKEIVETTTSTSASASSTKRYFLFRRESICYIYLVYFFFPCSCCAVPYIAAVHSSRVRCVIRTRSNSSTSYFFARPSAIFPPSCCRRDGACLLHRLLLSVLWSWGVGFISYLTTCRQRQDLVGRWRAVSCLLLQQ